MDSLRILVPKAVRHFATRKDYLRRGRFRPAGPASLMIAAAFLASACYLTDALTQRCPEGDALTTQLQMNLTAVGTGRVAMLRVQDATIEVMAVPWRYRCANLTVEEASSVLSMAAVVARDSRPHAYIPGGETVSWSLSRWEKGVAPAREKGVVVAGDMSSAGKTALRGIACLAYSKLPAISKLAIGGAMPDLARELGFPESCRATTRSTKPSAGAGARTGRG